MSYFFCYDDYQNASNNTCIGCTGSYDYNFKFTHMNFQNGSVIYLFETPDIREQFITYANLQNIKYIGCDNITERICLEIFGRTEEDILNETRQFSDYKYMVICSPLQLSHEYDPIGEIQELLKNVR